MTGWQHTLRFLVAAGLALVGTAYAQAPNAADKAFEASKLVAKEGPQDVALLSQATLKLPKGYVFIPQPQASELLNAMGNPGKDSRLQGLIFPQGNDAQWFITVRFESSGYIKDNDAKEWNAEDLLKSYREGTAESNKERAKMGTPGIEIIGWAEKPAYDAVTHRLVWAMSSKQLGASAGEPQGVNYNTYALGREGYFSLNLVTALQDLPQDKVNATTMLAALNFTEGKRYADFNSSTDRVAEYGLAALVAGGVAKKLGFFAILAAFFAKFAKLAIFAALAFGGGLWKWFTGRKKDEPVSYQPVEHQPVEQQPAEHQPVATQAPTPAAVAASAPATAGAQPATPVTASAPEFTPAFAPAAATVATSAPHATAGASGQPAPDATPKA
jgi:uncharacterized membrane-anchored protein